MVKLPANYTLIDESGRAVLAHNEVKREYVAWSKDTTGGVCWGHYFSYYDNYKLSKEKAYELAWKAFCAKI